jgi:hypothetical protein
MGGAGSAQPAGMGRPGMGRPGMGRPGMGRPGMGPPRHRRSGAVHGYRRGLGR